ncbi:hypothetical protein OPV22_021064 [Ensete ventricosum]|uniref:Uncharacterized protein n=1 Tax=Ensete ventricosum TaxID=4639 RepID=A0AAV8QPR8_ENSVE|nr:hypothetical protein OPV22_021064 [Ensete ventricosum]
MAHVARDVVPTAAGPAPRDLCEAPLRFILRHLLARRAPLDRPRARREEISRAEEREIALLSGSSQSATRRSSASRVAAAAASAGDRDGSDAV